MHALLEPRGPALDGQIMLRSVAYAVVCLLLVPVPGSGDLSRIQRDSKSGAADKWNYEDDKGPAKWPSQFHACGGSEQSPIDINTKDLDPNEDLDEIDFNNYDDDLDDAEMINNGHTVVVKPGDKDPELTITDGGLDDEYKLLEIHFHWGSDSKKGSEHTIDGRQYPLEMHLVHMNKKYKTKEAALAKEDGLAVLGVLFKVDNDDNDDFDPIIDQLDEIKGEGNKVELENLVVEKLLPDDRMPYYRYKGSLTTPPCNQVVTWTIFEEFVEISEKQLEQFRNLKEDDAEGTEPLANNFRPPQPLHDRVIEISTSSAHHVVMSVSMTLGLSALATAFTFFSRV